MIKFLHFSDAHIDIISQGRRDPESGLPIRVIDFLKALDRIIDAAIEEKVDLVLFAGDAFKDRNPASTYRREWDRRIMRLSQSGIPILLLVGNHDISPAAGRANTLHEFETLQVPNVKVLSQPGFLGPADLWGLPLQVIAIPYITRSTVMASLEIEGEPAKKIYSEMEERLTSLVCGWLDKKDNSLPLLLTAHASIEGAVYGQERSVILGNDLTLPGSLMKDPRIDYVAMGHIHKAQDVNKGHKPPIVYPGSIERVDFGEAADDKYYSLVELVPGNTSYKLKKLPGRKFYDRNIQFDENRTLLDAEAFMGQILEKLPDRDSMEDAMVRLVVRYPRDWEALLDETAIRKAAENAFEFHFIRQPFSEARLRLPVNQTVGSMTNLEMTEIYWKIAKTSLKEMDELKKLAKEIIAGEPGEQGK
jgi:DNA repair protein SbcD/Mre11